MADVTAFGQFPERRRSAERSLRSLPQLDIVLLLVVVGAPAVSLAARQHGVVAGVVVAAIAVVLLAVVRRPAVLAALAPVGPARAIGLDAVGLGGVAAATIVTAVLGGRLAGVALFVGALILVGVGTADGPQRAVGDPLVPPLAGVSLLAALTAWRAGEPMVALAVQVVALAIAVAGRARPAVVERVTSGVEGAAVGLGRLLGRAAFALLGLVFVIVPWCIQRLVAWDPTWSRRCPGSRFATVRDQPLGTRRQWSSTVVGRPRGARRRLHAVALLVVGLVVVGLPVALVARDGSTGTEGEAADDADGSAALADSPWWADARPAQLATYDEATVSGFVGPVLADVATEYTNVVDGRRRTWRPPETPAITVWIFGGSTAFGLGQRDDHTIASELAQLAWADGIALDVVNWGVHGDVHWMEWNRYRSAIAGGAEPPDLVLFYDGFNELSTVNYINNQGRAAGHPFLGSLDSTSIERDSVLDRLFRRVATISEDRGLVPTTPTSVLSPDGVVDAAVGQFDNAVQESSDRLRTEGVRSVVFYQPSRVTRSAPVDGEGDDGDEYRDQEEAFRSRLPDGVVDISGAIDGTTEPVYWDSVHHNELGSRMIAEAMYAEITDDLAALGKADG